MCFHVGLCSRVFTVYLEYSAIQDSNCAPNPSLTRSRVSECLDLLAAMLFYSFMYRCVCVCMYAYVCGGTGVNVKLVAKNQSSSPSSSSSSSFLLLFFFLFSSSPSSFSSLLLSLPLLSFPLLILLFFLFFLFLLSSFSSFPSSFSSFYSSSSSFSLLLSSSRQDVLLAWNLPKRQGGQ